MGTDKINIDAVESYMLELQNNITQMAEVYEPGKRFLRDDWQRDEGGGGQSRVISDGVVFEKAGVNFSNIRGKQMPASATHRNAELAGRSYQAIGVSVVMHPLNPMVPTSHMNVRFFVAQSPDSEPIWWFGGGFDLTPYYGFDEDAIHWHQMAKDACAEIDQTQYEHYKKWCDDYFYIKHRDEQRGIGGLFFDDLNSPDFDQCFSFVQSVGDHFIKAYDPIVARRHVLPFEDRHRQFQLYRRGRYVEFNLVYDRGTLFGLQSGGRVESILMSMPPAVRFEYDWSPAEDSQEAKLYNHYLIPRDWLRKPL